MSWKFTNEKRDVVFRTNEDGSMESCVADREDVVAWIEAGNVIAEPDLAPAAPEPTKQELLAQIAALTAKVQAL